MTQSAAQAVTSGKLRQAFRPEGEGGFSQAWYPIALSADVPAGAVRGYEFLNGRVIVFRGADGGAQTLSAYCPHMGADLACGDVVENDVRCAFHHWRFDREGRCLGTRVGDEPPRGARLAKFPTHEKYGLIWAFNGEAPLYDLPDFGVAEEALLIRAEKHSDIPHDPAVGVAGAFDMQHFWAVHEFEVDLSDHFERMRFEPFVTRQQVKARIIASDTPILWEVDVYGPNLIFMTGRHGDLWYGHISASCLRAPGRTEMFMITAVTKDTPRAQLDALAEHHNEEAHKDVDLLRHARFGMGAFTKTDKALAGWMAHMAKYPRHAPPGFAA